MAAPMIACVRSFVSVSLCLCVSVVNSSRLLDEKPQRLASRFDRDQRKCAEEVFELLAGELIQGCDARVEACKRVCIVPSREEARERGGLGEGGGARVRGRDTQGVPRPRPE